MILSLKILEKQIIEHGFNKTNLFKIQNIFLPLLFIITSDKKSFKSTVLFADLYNFFKKQDIFELIYRNYCNENSAEKKIIIVKYMNHLKRNIENYGEIQNFIQQKLNFILFGKNNRTDSFQFS